MRSADGVYSIFSTLMARDTFLFAASASSLTLTLRCVLPLRMSPVSATCEKYHKSSGVSTCTVISPFLRSLCVIFIRRRDAS